VSLVTDRAGNLFIADTFNGRIRMVSTDGVITSVAGGLPCYYPAKCFSLGDGGPAISARFGLLTGLAIDSAGNLYASDQFYNVIRVLRPAAAN
jgi:hypothetical protein